MKHLLVIGSGSVGKRHLQNFASLGCTLSAMDPKPDRLAEAASLVPLKGRYGTLREALDDSGAVFDGVVVCSPPRFHVEQCLEALNRRLPVFLEKPVAPDAASARRLAEAVSKSDVPLLLGYTYRWWPPLEEMRARVQSGEVGRILNVRCVMSAHLADWHPWERYQDFFMASRELGGGALLDESHFLDLVLWFFGRPSRVFALIEKLSALEIDTDDNVEAVLEYEKGPRVTIHLDLYGRPHEKYIHVTGDEGSLQWSFDPNRLRMGRGADQQWVDTMYAYERNSMFLAAAKEFLDVMTQGLRPRCAVQDGLDALEVIEAMRVSSLRGEAVSVSYGHHSGERP